MDTAHLHQVPLFAGLTGPQRDRIAQLADEVDVPAGKTLVHEGSFPYEFFAIESGTAEVTRDGEHVADLGPGDFFGEVGANGRFKRNATVTSTSDLTALVMTAQDFRRVAQELPAVGAAIQAAIDARSA